MNKTTSRTFYILVPVYNVESYIRACIESVLNQTNRNWKLILVDDGSTDASGVICDEYADRDNRITVIHKANGGQILARNTGIEEAVKTVSDTDCVLFLDSDDYLELNAIDVIEGTILRENCDMVVYAMQRVYGGEVLKGHRARDIYIGVIEDKRQLYRVVFNHSQYNSLCRKAISVRLLREIAATDYSNYYHIRHGEDLLQSMPLYEKCVKAVFIPDVLYNYTYNPKSITTSIRYENYKCNSTVRYMVFKFLKSQNVWNDRDFKEYMEYCCSLLENELRMISCFDTSTENIISLLKQIKADVYYSMVIDAAEKKWKNLRAMKNGSYKAMVMRFKARRTLSKIYHAIVDPFVSIIAE